MQFAHPNVLWLLLVIPPAIIGFYLWSARKRRALITAFIQARLLPSLLAGDSDTRRNIRLGLFLAAVCLVIVALARPQWGFTWEEVKQRGLDIVVAIDISKSMLAEDIPPNRLARAKLAALDLLQQARSDRLGLVAFAGAAFLQCPLTIDNAVFRQSLDALDVNTISRGGTAISEAIEAAMGAFTEEDNYKVLVLLTDGEDHDSGAMETARKAAERGLEIFTIGIGTTEGELLRISDASGKVDFVRDENGNAVKSRLDERFLQELAGLSTRGFYLPLRGPGVIDTLYAKGLAPIPRSEAGERLVQRFHEQFVWPLGLAILLLGIEILYPERKRERRISARRSALLASRSRTALLCGALTAGVLNSHASPGSALREYKAGDYGKSLREYKQLLERKPSDPRLHYNAGTAAYRDGQFTEAANHFDQATITQDLNLQQRAYYNRGNALYQLGEGMPDINQKKEHWRRSLQDYETALKLNSSDVDAAHNREYLQRRLEELKQEQQEQQNQQQKNDQKDEDKEQDQQQQQQPQPQDQGDQQQQPEQDQGKQNDPSQPEQDSESPEQKQNEMHDQQAGQQEQQKEGEEHPAQPEAHPSDQMTPEQARQLMDAMKGDEKLLQLKPKEDPAKARPLRDW
jgi:Ca-activated chloride channel homolog